MNARQTKKILKKHINKLRTDNNLMRKIISDSAEMSRLYDLYNRPLNVTHTMMQFREYRAKRYLPPERPDDAGFKALFERELAKDLFEGIKKYITYEVDFECNIPTITASIFVGVNDGGEMF